MKKQAQKTVKPTAFTDMVTTHKMKEVAPPESAKRDPMMAAQAKGETISKAAKEWMKAAKSQNPNSGFMDVASENLKPTLGSGRDMLYKGKKSKE